MIWVHVTQIDYYWKFIAPFIDYIKQNSEPDF